MKQVTRRRGRLAGTYTVYDNGEEAKVAGITTVLPWNFKSLQVGDWVQYANGRVAQVLRTTSNGQYIYTSLNLYMPKWESTGGEFKEYRLGSDIYDTDKVSPQLVKFAEDWLLRGESLEKSVTQNLWKFNRNRATKPSPMSARNYGYMILNGAWFDKLLESNRLMRDKYMNLVGAFDSNGINPDYLAKKIKEGIESEDVRKHINALNKAIEVLEAESNRRKSKPVLSVSAKYSEVTPPQIDQPTSVLDRIQIPQGAPHEQAERSPIGQTEGNTSVQTITSISREVGGRSIPEGHEAVSSDSSDWEGISLVEQQSRTEEV